MYQRAALDTGILITGMQPVKKLLKDRHCIYICNSGTSREEIV
jgi:hypothetical protein